MCVVTADFDLQFCLGGNRHQEYLMLKNFFSLFSGGDGSTFFAIAYIQNLRALPINTRTNRSSFRSNIRIKDICLAFVCCFVLANLTACAYSARNASVTADAESSSVVNDLTC